MEAFDGPCRRHANGTDKQLCAGFDGDLDELVQLAVGVIVVRLAG